MYIPYILYDKIGQEECPSLYLGSTWVSKFVFQKFVFWHGLNLELLTCVFLQL